MHMQFICALKPFLPGCCDSCQPHVVNCLLFFGVSISPFPRCLTTLLKWFLYACYIVIFLHFCTSPVLWQLCWHWWGSADTSYRMPSFASLESPGHPVEKEKERSRQILTHSLTPTQSGEVNCESPHLPGAALRWLGQMPQNHIMGTLQWVDDYLLIRG